MVRGLGLAVAGLLLAGVMAPPAAADGTDGFAVGGWIPVPETGVGSGAVLVDSADRILFVRILFNKKTIEVRRFLPDGRVDAGYGTAGVTTVPMETSPTWSDPGFQTAPDGALLVALRGIEQRIVRIAVDGTIDPTYGTAGELVGPFELDDDGRAYRVEQAGDTLVVERADELGHLDASYGGDGSAALAACDPPSAPVATVAPAGSWGALVTCTHGGVDTLVRLSPAGAVVATLTEAGLTGWSATPVSDGRVLLKRTASGDTQVRQLSGLLAPDQGFGDGGSVVLPGAPTYLVSSGARMYAVTLADSSVPNRRRLRVTAVDADGVDAGYGTGGTVRLEVGLPDLRTGFVFNGAVAASDGEDGLIVLAGAIPQRPVDHDTDFDSRFRWIDAAGRVQVETTEAPLDRPVLQPGSGAVIALSTEPSTLASGSTALRRFDPGPLRTAPFDSAAGFAQQLSVDVRGRVATPAEVASFVQGMADGVPAATLVRQALAEPAWASRVEPAVRLYWAYFGRPPDPTGLRYWMGKRAAGLTVARMSAVFADSSEFKRTYGSLTNQQFVELVYRNVMNREGDPGGIAYWTGRLDRRVTSRGQLMATFSESSEHVRRRAAQVSTVSLHLALLGRTPTADELTLWSGATPFGDADALARFLLASAAYADRVDQPNAT